MKAKMKVIKYVVLVLAALLYLYHAMAARSRAI